MLTAPEEDNFSSDAHWLLLRCSLRNAAVCVLSHVDACSARAFYIPVALVQVAGTVYGGENRDKEKARLRKGVNVLVATPGCGIDHWAKPISRHSTYGGHVARRMPPVVPS